MTIPQTIDPVWQSRAGDTPASLAAVYRDAAQRIRARGYDGATVHGDYEGSRGISICAALKQAAEAHCGGLAADGLDLAEELETRLATVLYLTGQLTQRTGIRGLPDQVAAWETTSRRWRASGRPGTAGTPRTRRWPFSRPPRRCTPPSAVRHDSPGRASRHGARAGGPRTAVPLCPAAPGAPCQAKPEGDHLARYLDAYTAGQLTREYLAAAFADLVVITRWQIIPGGGR